MKKLLLALCLITIVPVLSQAQCRLPTCQDKAKVYVTYATSSNTISNACYIGSGELYEYGKGYWKERNFIGQIVVKNKMPIPPHVFISIDIITIFDSLTLNGHDTIQVSGTLGIGDLVVMGSPSVIILVDTASKVYYKDSFYTAGGEIDPNLSIILCTEPKSTSIVTQTYQKQPKRYRPGIYTIEGRQLPYEPKNQVYIKDGKLSLILN